MKASDLSNPDEESNLPSNACEISTAKALLEEAINVHRSFGDPEMLAESLRSLASLNLDLGHPYVALPLLEEARSIFQGLGDEASSVEVSKLLSLAHMEIGDPKGAKRQLTPVLSSLRQRGESEALIEALSALAAIHTGQGEHRKTGINLYESLDDLCEYANSWSIEVGALEGWRLMRRGQALASQGLLNEAWIMMERGESALGCRGGLAPTRFIWTSIGVNDWLSTDGASGPSGKRAS